MQPSVPPARLAPAGQTATVWVESSPPACVRNVMRSTTRYAVLAGVLLSGGAAALAQYGDPQTIGQEAKELFRFRDQKTNEIIFSLKRYRGRVLAFYFWTSRNQESVRMLATVNGL